ncbi:choline/ethanolamine kinase-like isoform X2 [Clavelina lepadiformis]|uniref:choline/ethanolamine kinase-like isoform X2 n=1 Tax=Clavelina lepadiformis TaxID=159417 RepID=UPI004043023F
MDIMTLYNTDTEEVISCCHDNSQNNERLGLDVVNRAYLLCKEYLQGPWAEISLNEFEITPLGGGLTNKLYVCNLPTEHRSNDNERNCPNTVLLRIYGLILQDFKAQIQESVVFSILAERGVGPRLYAVFPGGRLEEYLPSRTLKTSDLNDLVLSRHIGERLSEYHRLVMPVKKDPTFIMSKMFKYLEKSKNVHFSDSYKESLYLQFMQHDVSEEVQFVKRMVLQMQPVVVFCHNDAQEGNLLCADDNNRQNPVQMIDFEYSSYNYRGFDIGNHFCEWMYDYSHPSWPFYSYKPENFPTREQQLIFVDSYLESMYKAVPSRKNDSRWSREFVLKEADRLVLLSHIFWALWSIVQAQISDIGFGYLEYALARIESYFHHKKQLNLNF